MEKDMQGTRNLEETAKDEEPKALEECLNLRDIERLASKKLTAQAWAYYYSASDDLISKDLNSDVYRRILMRPRTFIDVSRCSTATTILGHDVAVPFFVSPAALAGLAHPTGECGIAHACKKFGVLQMISCHASYTPKQIVESAGPDSEQILGWQMSVQTDRTISEEMIRRVSRLPQIKFICLSVDAPVSGKREHDERYRDGASSRSISKELFVGTASDLRWDTTLPWLRQHTSLPIVLKGIQTFEDARLAARLPKVKGIILSNHGGRGLDTASPSIHTLLEIRKYCPEVMSKLEVYVDGGIYRGTDVVKALCLGARAVGLGRAPLYGLSIAVKFFGSLETR